MANEELQEKREHAKPFLKHLNAEATKAKDRINDQELDLDYAKNLFQFIYRRCKK